MFIVFEGVDGAGKTGFIHPFKEMLESITEKKVNVTREPGGTPFGEAMRKVILSAEHKASPMTELLAMMTIRMQHIEELIKPALARDEIVLCDRFHLSTIAFQCIPNGIDESVYYELHQMLYKELYPDVTVLFNTSRETINQRKSFDLKDRFESRDSTFYDQLDSFYDRASKADTFNLYGSVVTIDNNGSIENTTRELKKLALTMGQHLR